MLDTPAPAPALVPAPSPEESNARLLQAQDEAVQTLRELCRPFPSHVHQTEDRAGATRAGASALHHPAALPVPTRDSSLITDTSDLRARRLALQEASIRLRAATILLRTKPRSDQSDGDSPSTRAGPTPATSTPSASDSSPGTQPSAPAARTARGASPHRAPPPGAAAAHCRPRPTPSTASPPGGTPLSPMQTTPPASSLPHHSALSTRRRLNREPAAQQSRASAPGCCSQPGSPPAHRTRRSPRAPRAAPSAAAGPRGARAGRPARSGRASARW